MNTEPHQPIVSAVVGMVEYQGAVLVAERKKGSVLEGMLELPGGKIETSETALYALTRELEEEINIRVLKASFWFQEICHYPHGTVYLDLWKVEHFEGTPEGREGQKLLWCTPTLLQQWIEQNAPFIPITRKALELWWGY